MLRAGLQCTVGVFIAQHANTFDFMYNMWWINSANRCRLFNEQWENQYYILMMHMHVRETKQIGGTFYYQ